MSPKRVEGLHTCPNCGAPLDLDTEGRCRWCDVPVEVSPPGSPSPAGQVSGTFQGATVIRPGGQARRLIFALIIGALTGLAIVLQVRSWRAVAIEGAIPRPAALLTSLMVGLTALSMALTLVFRKGWTRRGFLAVGVAGGLLAGQSLAVGKSLLGVQNVTDLTIAWTAPFDSSPDLTTVSAWVSGGSLVRVRADEVVSYGGATGQPRWTLPIPGTDVACSVSNDTGTVGTRTIGLVMYGQDSTTCDHIMAVDLATGRQLWAAALPSSYGASSPLGGLGLAAGTAVVLTDDGVVGLNARSGSKRWVNPSSDCTFEGLAGSGGTAVALASCGSSDYVAGLNPATGKMAWRYKITQPSDNYYLQILSASPVVIIDNPDGPRATTAEVWVFGPRGAVTARFPISGILDPASGRPLTLNTDSTDGFGSPEVIADGALVGVAGDSSGHEALVAFGLSSGKSQWVVPFPDDVNDITVGGRAQRGEVVLVDESDPRYSLEEVGIATGKLNSLGFFSQQELESGDSGLYTVGNDYLVVNRDGSNYTPPISAIKAPAPPAAPAAPGATGATG